MNQEEMERKKLMSKITANDFVKLNGALMRAIGTAYGSHRFKVSDLLMAFSERQEGELLESLNYLEKAGYLEAIDAESKIKVEIQYAEPEETNAILTAKGIRLVKYIETDNAVEV